MKRSILLFLLATAAATLLVGCGSRYVLVTSDYTIHIATSKPELDPSTGTLTFTDEHGQEVSIPKDDMKQTRELRD
ncbi:putative Lipoprotein [uncultured delta proteobacterium]|uniref:Putative Lipoprotein n=1 Tax=uncultured delta proteobacterium TaxID=34034 RepID=A0A212KC77_9DELT|nr:putative Lipoprotein [uncultured delta proteobacterium]